MTIPLTGGPELHEALAEARARSWYAHSPLGFPVLLRYRDCERLNRDPRFQEIGIQMLHLSGITDGPLHDWFSLIMFANDGEPHRRLRSLVSMAFTPKRVEAQRPSAAAAAGRLCDGVGDELELVSDVAHWMPVLAVAHMLGIPDDDVPQFAGWSARLGAVFSAFITPETRIELEETLGSFGRYVRELIADRRSHPRDDLTTRLIEARDGEDRLSEDELVAMIANVLLGGHDATERLLANAVFTLLSHPDQWRALAANPALAAAAVEEVLRYEPSVAGTGRIAAEDVDWDGLEIAAGSIVGTSTLAANRDPEVFADPDVFSITRDDRRHLAFGGGPHLCIGAALARVVGQETLIALSRRWPDLTLVDVDPPWAPPTAGFRGITRLRLATGRR